MLAGTGIDFRTAATAAAEPPTGTRRERETERKKEGREGGEREGALLSSPLLSSLLHAGSRVGA